MILRREIKEVDMVENYDPLFDKKEVAKYFSYRCLKTLERHVRDEQFPKPDTFIGNSPRWLLSTLNKHKECLLSKSAA